MKNKKSKNISSETLISSETSDYTSDNITSMVNNLNIGDTLKIDIRMEKVGYDLIVKESSSKINKAEPQNTSYANETKSQQTCPYGEIEELLNVENILDTESLTQMVKEASDIFERYKAEEECITTPRR
uniref:Uncharacterized protein n=1 Tax=Strongyloides papillosus TaxID=174720 RepID=A0A0N5BNL0_STREA